MEIEEEWCEKATNKAKEEFNLVSLAFTVQTTAYASIDFPSIFDLLTVAFSSNQKSKYVANNKVEGNARIHYD